MNRLTLSLTDSDIDAQVRGVLDRLRAKGYAIKTPGDVE